MQSKKVGGKRFTGAGVRKKWDPFPGTVQWYEQNLPEKLNNTAINIRNGLGIPMEDYEGEDGKTHDGAKTMAARVLAWSEKPLSKIPFPIPDKCSSCGIDLVNKVNSLVK